MECHMRMVTHIVVALVVLVSLCLCVAAITVFSEALLHWRKKKKTGD